MVGKTSVHNSTNPRGFSSGTSREAGWFPLSHFPRQKKQNSGKIDVKPHHHHKRFTALFPGPPGWGGARTELLYFMVQGEINRGRHADHPAGRHFIRTNQCPPPLSPYFLRAGCPSCCPTNSIKPKYNPAVKSTICLSQWLSGTYTVRAVSDGYQHQSDFSPQCGYISREL